MNAAYGQWFYERRHQQTVASARTLLTVVLDVLPPVRSAIDVGCGVGTWLAVLREEGVEEVCGVDGPWVDRELLEIAEDEFREMDLEKEFVTPERYDLALSLEVAEHLPPDAAGGFVDTLTAVSDFVLFSAAIPRQGGRGHVNEQWPGYWAALFAERGYAALDFVRRRIWDDERIPAWYRQNVLLFAKEERVAELALSPHEIFVDEAPPALVHPETYLSRLDKASRRGPLRSIRRKLLSWRRKR